MPAVQNAAASRGLQFLYRSKFDRLRQSGHDPTGADS